MKICMCDRYTNVKPSSPQHGVFPPCASFGCKDRCNGKKVASLNRCLATTFGSPPFRCSQYLHNVICQHRTGAKKTGVGRPEQEWQRENHGRTRGAESATKFVSNSLIFSATFSKPYNFAAELEKGLIRRRGCGQVRWNVRLRFREKTSQRTRYLF